MASNSEEALKFFNTPNEQVERKEHTKVLAGWDCNLPSRKLQELITKISPMPGWRRRPLLHAPDVSAAY